jgi:hypothetical protein
MLDSLLKASSLPAQEGAYTTKCVEGEFSELRLIRVLRTSQARSSRKFAKKVPKLAHLGYALSHGVAYKGKVHQAFSEQPKGC